MKAKFIQHKFAVTIAAACAAVALLVATVSTAYGFFYVHNDDLSSTDHKGVCQVFVIVDWTAVDPAMAIKTDVVYMPEGSVAKDVLDEAVDSSEAALETETIHDHEVTSLREALEGYNYTIDVYETAESNTPQSHRNYNTDDNGTTSAEGNLGSALYGYEPYGDENTELNRYDNVYITVSN